MLAFFFLSGSIILGIGVIRRITRELLDEIDQFFWGLLVGWVLAAFGAYLVARWQGQLTHSQVLSETISIWIVAATVMALDIRSGRFHLSKFRWRRQYSGLLLVLLIFTPIYWRLFSTHMFARGDGGWYSGGSAAYDLSFHAALTSSFLYGQNFPPRYIFLPPAVLNYPFLPDFQTAVLMTGGLTLRTALMLTSLSLAVAITALFYSLAYRIFRSQRGAVFASLIFFLNGGLGFIDFFRDWWHSGKNFIQFWQTLDVNYANYSSHELHWPNVIADAFLPQRTSLFGLAIALIIFTTFAIAWRRWHQDDGDAGPNISSKSTWALLSLAGFLAGLLPITHTHSYIAVGLVSVCLFAFRPRWAWAAFWIPAIGLAAPQVIALTQNASATGVVRLLPGWLGHDQSFRFPIYLLRNFGLPLVLAVPAWLAAPRSWRKFYVAFLVVFVFALVVMVSPNVFDNGKLTYYWHAINSIFAGSFMVRVWQIYRQRVLAFTLVIISIATGVIALHSENLASTRVVTDEDLAAGEFVRNHTSPGSLFLIAPTFANPITLLAGRAVVRGPTAWLASHGYEFRDREADVRRIYGGTSDALELVRYYGIDFIYVGDRERAMMKANPSFFDHNFRAIYRSATVTVYDANLSSQPATQSGATRTLPPRALSSRLDRDPYALLIDFPHTSFFVYRLFRTSYGRLPRRDEFLTTLSQLVKGVSIGAAGWQDQLDHNREQLLDDWVKTNEFQQAYAGRSRPEMVESLIRNAGINWTTANRNSLNSSCANTMWQRCALLAVTEDRDFCAREYNTAYVLMHFFAYLRRNPDDAPDGDLRGLNFWRMQLDRWGDYRGISMAFLESPEYDKLPPTP